MTHIKIKRQPVETPITEVVLHCGVPLTLQRVGHSGGGLVLKLNSAHFGCASKFWVEWLEAALLLARQEVAKNG